MDLNIDELISMASIYQNIGKYKESLNIFDIIITQNPNLNNDFTHLYGSIVKSTVDHLRNSLYIFSEQIDLNMSNIPEGAIDKIQQYFDLTFHSLELICENVINNIDNILLKYIFNDEREIFLIKLKEDLYRYIGEFNTNPFNFIEKSRNYYQLALEKSDKILNDYHPTKLSLILNYSVLKFEFLKNFEEAIDLLQNSFNKNINNLNDLSENSKKECISILSVMESNLEQWIYLNNSNLYIFFFL